MTRSGKPRDPRKLNPIERRLDDYVVLDTETTGLSFSKGARLTEIGAVKVTDGAVTDSFDQLIDPGCPVPERITELTGIDNAMVAGQPDAAEVIAKLEDWLGPDAIILAHNAWFDFSFLDPAAQSAFATPRFGHRYLDLLEMSHKVHPEKRHHRVADLIIDYRIAQTEAHRALSDAEQEQAIYEAMCAEAFA